MNCEKRCLYVELRADDIMEDMLFIFSVGTKDPEMFNKHFGHLKTDEALGKQGRNVIMYLRAVKNCIKEGNEADALEKMHKVEHITSPIMIHY